MRDLRQTISFTNHKELSGPHYKKTLPNSESLRSSLRYISMRRRFFIYLFAVASLSPLHAQEPLFPKAPGVVSFTFRESFKKDMPGTLDRIKALGITDIEFSDLFGHSATEVKKMLDDRGMTCSSYGASFDTALNQTAEAAAIAKTLGASYVRVAWIPHTEPFTLESISKLAEDFNTIGKRLKEEHGLIYCYHNHGFEFIKENDTLLFHVLVEKTNPEWVSYEIDILWAFLPGTDPAALIEKYPDRFKLMHLKDLKKGVPSNQTGKMSGENDVPLGTGQIDLPAVLKAAKQSKIAHYYIEDESSKPWEQVPQSMDYLKSLKE